MSNIWIFNMGRDNMDCNGSCYSWGDRSRGIIPCVEHGSTWVDCRSISYDSLCSCDPCFYVPPLWLLQISWSWMWPHQKSILHGSCWIVFGWVFYVYSIFHFDIWGDCELFYFYFSSRYSLNWMNYKNYSVDKLYFII